MNRVAGIVLFDGWPVEPGLVEKMTLSMAQRVRDGIIRIELFERLVAEMWQNVPEI